MTVIADEGLESIEYITPEQLKRAILKSKNESGGSFIDGNRSRTVSGLENSAIKSSRGRLL